MNNRPNNIQCNENTYLIINIISKLYTNTKLKNEAGIIMNNLIEKIEDLYGNKLIRGVIDYYILKYPPKEKKILKVLNAAW